NSISFFFFFSSRRRHTRSKRDWSSDVCSSDLKVTEVSIGPASEWILTDEDYSRAAKGLASLLEESMKKMKQSEAKELTKDFIEGDLEKLEARQRSEEHTSELQSRFDLVCRLLLEKKK